MLSGQFFRNRLTRNAAVILGLSFAPVISGCGKAKEPWKTAYPARGVVKFQGNPVANAEIAFFPQGKDVPDSVRPRALTGDDGSFVVWTYEKGDGAPAGNYKVTVVHNKLVEKNGVAVMQPNDLPPKYALVQTTDLVAEIGKQETELPPIELQGPVAKKRR